MQSFLVKQHCRQYLITRHTMLKIMIKHLPAYCIAIALPSTFPGYIVPLPV